MVASNKLLQFLDWCLDFW